MLPSEERDLQDFILPTSTVVKESLRRVNSAIRGVEKDQIHELWFNWKFEDLPPVGKDVKIPQLAKRQDLGISDLKKNCYLTVEIPQGGSKQHAYQDISKQIHFANRRDAMDLLLSHSFTEHAMDAAVRLLQKEKSSEEERKSASDALLAAVLSHKTQVGLITRVLANSTMLCR